jgi:endonuclease-3
MNRRAQRVKELIVRFRETYPDAHCELNFSSPLELLVATILSAQCTDKRVNQVTVSLFKKYPSAAAYAAADPAELENDIKSTGFFRNKTKSLRGMSSDLVKRFAGQVPKSMGELTSLAGVGRKTANVVLGNAFQLNEGIVVDTHVARLAHRLGLTKETEAEKIEADLMQLVLCEDWTLFSHWLIWHGRRRCTALRPDCEGCEVRTLCPSYPITSPTAKKPNGPPSSPVRGTTARQAETAKRRRSEAK